MPPSTITNTSEAEKDESGAHSKGFARFRKSAVLRATLALLFMGVGDEVTFGTIRRN
jgi:hypothetical protein